MHVARQQPLNPVRRIHDEMNRMLGAGVVPARPVWPQAARRTSGARWTPAVDIREEDDRYVIAADVPGIDPADIEITMDDGVLSIKGERKPREPGADARWRRVERADGGFERRFSLPDGADAEAITASSSHGVLEVSIPKQKAAQPRRIQVS